MGTITRPLPQSSFCPSGFLNKSVRNCCKNVRHLLQNYLSRIVGGNYFTPKVFP